MSEEGKRGYFGNIILIGFMGSGKTTVGIRLSYCLRRVFTDTDKLIEKKEGKSIIEIFEENGEETFRGMETKLLQELVLYARKSVLSVGGGTPVIAQNRGLLKKLGIVVYLRVRPESIYERLKGDNTRPLLMGGNPLEKITKLLAERKEIYEGIADIIVDADQGEVEDIVEKIVNRWYELIKQERRADENTDNKRTESELSRD